MHCVGFPMHHIIFSRTNKNIPVEAIHIFGLTEGEMGMSLADTDLLQAPTYFNPHSNGINYKKILGKISDTLKPRTYLEIGTQMGASLSLFHGHCIAIDPNFQPKQDIIGPKKSLQLFQMTSDEFFANFNVKSLVPSVGTLDFCFLDGMHHFEFLLRDFINSEKACRPDSVIAMHDTFPTVPRAVARRPAPHRPHLSTRRPISPTGGGWAGDVWKVVGILKQYRPDLEMISLDTPPTGLSLITHLDPKNDTLTKNYDKIVKDWMSADAQEGWFDAHYDAVELTASRPLMDSEKLLQIFSPFQ